MFVCLFFTSCYSPLSVIGWKEYLILSEKKVYCYIKIHLFSKDFRILFSLDELEASEASCFTVCIVWPVEFHS